MLHSHEGHHLHEPISTIETDFFQGNFRPFLNWLGSFHFVILHFPIALVVMTVVAEIMFLFTRKSEFEQAAYFMIISAAIWAPPTALLGWALSYGSVYEGVRYDLFAWHRYFGSVTAILAVAAAFLRYSYRQRRTTTLTYYYTTLFFLFLSVFLTGLLGGSLVFG